MAERTLLLLKKCVVLQVNDVAVRIKLVIFVLKVKLFINRFLGEVPTL